MKRFVCIVLALLMLSVSAAVAEENNVSITTGLPTDGPAKTMVVQFDNEPGARPQKGIASADIVYEVELYNGGFTRYTAVFNDNVPELVEAVRSARIVNADIYSEYGGAFVHYGGQVYEGSNVYNYLNSIGFDAEFDGLSKNAKAASMYPGAASEFYRDNSRKAPNNVICRLSNLYNRVDWSGIACKSPLKFSQTATVPQGEDVTSFRIPYRGSYTPSYQWDAASGKYLRFYNDKPYVDGATDEQVTADNVIVQAVEYSWYSGESDRPNVATTGTNRCDYFFGGRHFTGYWTRDDVKNNTVYYDDAGNEVLFNPGVTFIQLIKTEYSVEILG